MPFSKNDPNINRKGRPKKGETFAEALEREASTEVNENGLTKRDALAKVLYKKASEGDLKAIEMIMDRVDGKPRQVVDQTNKNLTVNITQEDADNVI